MALFPAHAGVIPTLVCVTTWKLPFPRTRGGDPQMNIQSMYSDVFSPHTQG